MAEEQAQERSLPASPRRLEKARAEGQVPRSTELSTSLVLLTALGALWWGGGAMFDRLGVLLQSGLRLDRQSAFDPAILGARFVDLALAGFSASAPVLIALIAAALAAPIALGGWNLSWQAIAPQASRIDPLAGLQRLFSGRGLVELAKASLKAVLLGAIGAWLIVSQLDAVASLTAQGLRAAVASSGQIVLFAFGVLAAATALVAALDVPLQLWRHQQSLRMSPQEMREEARESEGDPQLRARIRAQQREIARRRMMSAVPKADVVVTNPTHYAVAIAYSEDRGGAPRVVAKGAGAVAARIREIAQDAGVPLLEAPPLARALFRHVDIDAEVPRALYDAVAQVLAWVYQVRRRSGAGRMPVPPQDLPVPPALDFTPQADS